MSARHTSPGPIPPPLVDEDARGAIRTEREQNLLVIAGAGTGKTTSIIDRVMAFIVPPKADLAPVPIDRLAVITFTRRAAGELRFRIRERILSDLDQALRARDQERSDLLRAALTALDAAAIGTIHGFADSLLRLRPIEARLSPAYVLAEDNESLMRETFRRLRVLVETGELADELEPALSGATGRSRLTPELVSEAEQTIRAATRSGLTIERRENAYGTEVPSLEGVIMRMIEKRDIEFTPPAVPDPGLEAMKAAISTLAELKGRIVGSSRGARHVRHMITQLETLCDTDDPEAAFALLREAIDGITRKRLQKGRDFDGAGQVGWRVLKAFRGESPGKGSIVPEDLPERLLGPYRWLAARIVRLAPVAEALYDQVKAEHESVDFVDILIKLRNLLRDNPEVRRFYQDRFAHIFVDEFQDTDPLQCEILFYLCEDGARAGTWSEVELRPGRLTLVGDPKQSIYRFRRADVATYAEAESMLRAQGARVISLVTNFRSRPELVRYLNARLADVLDRPDPKIKRSAAATVGGLDAESGQAFYGPIEPAPGIPPGPPPVHVVPYAGAGGESLHAEGEGRPIESEAIAAYVDWLLASGFQVRDPATGAERAVRAGDIAVLAATTTHLDHLLERFDAHGIEYSIRGGKLLLSHPLVRRYLLALRAIADPDDGVAAAALHAPPFFALDAADLALDRAAFRLGKEALGDVPAAELDERLARVRAATDLVRELRRERHARPPGATARDLIERTGLGRAVLAGANGRQMLSALYQVAFEIERRAIAEGLDFDTATIAPRDWADRPVYLDLPEPMGEEAVRVTTIHQAKGLEYPVVIIWDGFQVMHDWWIIEPWLIGRDRRSWALGLRPVKVAEPVGSDLAEREQRHRIHEKARLFYVAATRARDLLVLPLPSPRRKDNYATACLAGRADDEVARELIRWFEPYRPDQVPEWARGGAAPRRPCRRSLPMKRSTANSRRRRPTSPHRWPRPRPRVMCRGPRPSSRTSVCVP